ncbi:MAG TPA: hypothetical protein VGQ76_26875, partial [Thermoanaerobaculia bacterium]|nr:hypothetical protein [Thermoanaerobaculia bacterium]
NGRRSQLTTAQVCFILRPMEEPEYLICLQCETPTYQFDFAGGKLSAVVCTACGNDDPSDFATEAEFDEMV